MCMLLYIGFEFDAMPLAMQTIYYGHIYPRLKANKRYKVINLFLINILICTASWLLGSSIPHVAVKRQAYYYRFSFAFVMIFQEDYDYRMVIYTDVKQHPSCSRNSKDCCSFWTCLDCFQYSSANYIGMLFILSTAHGVTQSIYFMTCQCWPD